MRIRLRAIKTAVAISNCLSDWLVSTAPEQLQLYCDAGLQKSGAESFIDVLNRCGRPSSCIIQADTENIIAASECDEYRAPRCPNTRSHTHSRTRH